MTGSGRNKTIIHSIIFLFILARSLSAQIDFSYQSDYSYLKGKDAVSLSSVWMTPGFDYSGWTKGKAPYRYGDGAALSYL